LKLYIKKAWDRYVAEMPPDHNEITRTSFNLLRRGEMPSVSRVANALGRSKSEIESLLMQMAGNGSVTVEEGCITGVGGLSSTPTLHRLVLDGVKLYCWCALDTLGISAALVADASIVSPDANGGSPIALQFEKGRLAETPEKILLQLAPPDQARLLCGGT
jgi:alkylmercury lyase